MKNLNQRALPLQLRPRWGLHLIYSPKPGNQAIKRNQTLRFPALNGPTVFRGRLGTPVNSFEVAVRRCRPRPFGVRTNSLLTERLHGCHLRGPLFGRRCYPFLSLVKWLWIMGLRVQALSRLSSNLLKCPHAEHSGAQEAANRADGESGKVATAEAPVGSSPTFL